MKVAVDLDGTAYDWQRTVRYMLNNYRGCEIPPLEDFWFHWDAVDQYTTEEDRDWLWTEGIRLGLYRYGHVTQGAILGLQKILRRNHELLVVTHRPQSAVQDTIDWLSYIKIPWAEIHILSDGEPKTSVTADVLIDDKVENVREWQAAGRKGLLFDRPWNWYHADARGLERVKGWEGVLVALKV